MGDNVIRHMVALAASIVCLLAFYSGYISGGHGWWWTSAGVLIVYGGVYKLVDK